MGPYTKPSACRLAALLGLLACAVLAQDDVSISAEMDQPDWMGENAMQLQLRMQAKKQPPEYTVVPLTPNLGANQSSSSREAVKIQGDMVLADDSTYTKVKDNQVAYLSCDGSTDNDFLNPQRMLLKLMETSPQAIVLFSTSGTWCSISSPDPLEYTSIFTMADTGEADSVLSNLNGTSNGRTVEATITGSSGGKNSDNSSQSNSGHKSAVAMTILYAITGLISVLFLTIIATGAIRAHRYPERYGPRRGMAGRPRQSRAKGLARAVLDTIPIVKFGNQSEAKPDLELELENTTATGGQDAAVQHPISQDSNVKDRSANAASVVPASADREDGSTTAKAPETPGSDAAAETQYPGCSICTDDFKVGDDVRVLPCSHQFHPACIDPWLVNVSGTCPLCRYDLQPEQADTGEGSANGGNNDLPPPLALDGIGNDDAHPSSHRHRISRIFDVNRLRQASREEQIEALRQMRAQENEAEQQQQQETHEGEARRQNAHFTAKLRDKFRIRTRAGASDGRDG